MLKQLISTMYSKTTSDINHDAQLKSKCFRLLRNDEIQFVGMINNMGNLVCGGFSKGVDLIKTDEQQRKLYMQTALEISMHSDFYDTLGNTNYVTVNTDNLLRIIVPMNKYTMLIFAKPTSKVERIITAVHDLRFFQSEIR